MKITYIVFLIYSKTMYLGVKRPKKQKWTGMKRCLLHDKYTMYHKNRQNIGNLLSFPHPYSRNILHISKIHVLFCIFLCYLFFMFFAFFSAYSIRLDNGQKWSQNNLNSKREATHFVDKWLRIHLAQLLPFNHWHDTA